MMSGAFRSVVDWRISILVVQTRDCSLSGPQWYQVGIALFAPTIPVDVLGVKSYVNSVFISRYVCTNVGLEQ